MATSAPAPMAMPISARVRAGASLMPSPTMATLPLAFKPRITLSLPSGNTPAMTSSTPACLPMALAVFSLSPVSMMTRRPIFRSSVTAWAVSSLITSATAMMPSRFPSAAKNSGVFPSSANRFASFSIFSGTVATLLINFRLPPDSLVSPTFAAKPLPGSAWKAVTSRSSASPCPRWTMARAKGCSLFFSNA